MFFGLQTPQRLPAVALDSHVAVTCAPRSMHELHWLPLARAYVLTVLVDETEEMSGNWTSPDIPKTFNFAFAQSKDSKHVVTGFSRSLKWAGVEGDLSESLVAVLRGREVHRGDFLSLRCEPHLGEVVVRLERSGELLDERRIKNADELISGLHRIFLSDEKYKHMFARLCKNTVHSVPDPCRPYLA